MVIHFSKINEIKIDSVCKAVRKTIPNSTSTRGEFRDFVVDSIFTELSETQINSLLTQYIKKVGTL